LTQGVDEIKPIGEESRFFCVKNSKKDTLLHAKKQNESKNFT